MKKFKQYALLALLVVAVVCILSGASLARPERVSNAENTDKFVGVYVVFGPRDFDRSNWVAYGEQALETEFGTFSLPNEVLFATYDETTNRWTFPGVEGYCAFVTERNDISTGSDGLQSDCSIAYNNDDCTGLSGTIFVEKSEQEYYVTYYNVYETADGKIYIDGTGNSMSGPASSGGAMGTSRENTYRENGKVISSYEFSVSVDIEPVVPTRSLTLVQYDANDQELSRTELALEQQHITPSPDTAWMLVIECDKEGILHRTAYEPPLTKEDWVAHNLYLAQPDGRIQIKTLFFDVAA